MCGRALNFTIIEWNDDGGDDDDDDGDEMPCSFLEYYMELFSGDLRILPDVIGAI